MQIIAQPYTFTAVDRQRIEALGYRIAGIPPDRQLESFVPALFPNFDLASLLEMVDKLFAPTTPLPIQRRIQYNVPAETLHFIFRNSTANEDEAVAFDRVVLRQGGELLVKHMYCLVPLPYQGKGLIKPIFQASLQQYVNMGIRKIMVHAGLGGGGYTWARHGFVAVEPNEVQTILNDAYNKLSANEINPVQRIFSKYYSDHPAGAEFPMILWASLPGMKEVLRGSDWNGSLDLHNPEQFRNFSNYVFRP
jgi:hypothetical protein